MRNKELPGEWRHANVSVIYKKGKKSVPNNYRPVSLTCIVCKVLESIVRDKIIDHMKKNKLFSEKQFGSICGRSTQLQLLKVLELWTESLDKGLNTDVIYMDFRKAFDTVPHRRLIGKLESYGLTGWIEAFLSNRTQKVVINGEASDVRPVISGIPQGSVLGPILFVMYINDMPDIVTSQIFLFADDTKIFREILDESDHTHLQKDLDELQNWSNTWLLKFHPEKCKAMTIGKGEPDRRVYTLENNTGSPLILLNSEEERDLGVIIDSKLKFEDHITKKVNKANAIMGAIRRSYKYLDENTFLLLFKALVRPHLEYAAAAWCPWTQKLVDLIEGVQRRGTKLIPNLKDLSYQDRLRALKLPTLRYRRLRGDMIETYKILNNIYDQEVSRELLQLNTCPLYNTRGNDLKLFNRHARLNTRKYFFSNRITEAWNSLPNIVINAPYVASFERRIDKIWRDEEFVYNHNLPFKKTTRSRSKPQELDIEASPASRIN